MNAFTEAMRETDSGGNMKKSIVYTPEEAMKIRKVLINIGHLEAPPKEDDEYTDYRASYTPSAPEPVPKPKPD